MFIIITCLFYIGCSIFTGAPKVIKDTKGYFNYVKKNAIVPAFFIAVAVLTMFIGSIFSLEVFRSKSYRELLPVYEGDFATDIKEISADKIPMLDRDSAMILGDRKLGELADMVSQFEVAKNYTQINYNDRPVRVTPLMYGDTIKWLVNQKEGIPAYIVLDMATQEVDVVRLDEGIKYSESEYFNRKKTRYVQLKYPTFMFDTPTFEIDEEGVPYWICPKIVKKIGLFGGTDIEGAVLVNAITGESEYYKDVPNWVDRLYNSDLILAQYNYYGRYVNGFFNSMFGQKDVTVTTAGHNYIALNDDVYLGDDYYSYQLFPDGILNLPDHCRIGQFPDPLFQYPLVNRHDLLREDYGAFLHLVRTFRQKNMRRHEQPLKLAGQGQHGDDARMLIDNIVADDEHRPSAALHPAVVAHGQMGVPDFQPLWVDIRPHRVPLYLPDGRQAFRMYLHAPVLPTH